MGPLFEREKPPRIDYPQIETVALQYHTDSDSIKELLPECYQPAKEPIVTVMFGYNDGLEFMAGGAYRIATVQVAARFDSEHEHVEGDYILVMFEDKTIPIIGGREDLGVPKLYADISPVKRLSNKHLRCEASIWGHLLFGMDLEPTNKQNAIVRLAASNQINKRPWLAYKYIPSIDGPPDADYPTITKNDVKIEQLWLGKSGKVFFGDSGVEDIASLKHIVDALKTLKVNQVIQTVHFRGSAVLRYDLSHRLQ